MPDPLDVPDPTDRMDCIFTAHLVEYLGAWPPPPDHVSVVETPLRLRPAWDGAAVVAVVLTTPEGSLISVPPGSGARVTKLTNRLDDPSFGTELCAATGAGGASPWLVVRWTTRPAELAPIGEWVSAEDPRLPEWLQRFPGRVLAAFDDGHYLGGLGLKPHTRYGREMAVGTAEYARGRGIARRLVATAARATLDDGAIPLYVHHPDNAASARVADAAGVPDRGWRLLVAQAPPA